MAPGNNERHPNHTGTIPKTKVRNNCNVPQEAVTPTRRDMAANLVSTSLDWVPVSEYNSRSNYNQTRKQTNNTSASDPELHDLENSVAFESGFGRFVPVRPQPRALPLNVQNRDNIGDHNDDGAGSSASGHTSHSYGHAVQNGLIPHSNHAAAAVMIVNPTTPNAIGGNMSQPFNTSSQNRNNLTRNLNPSRNNFEGQHNHTSNHNSAPSSSHSRTGTKTVNLINNMYDQGQGSLNNVNDNNHVHRESARALGEAIVAACPDAAAVERRLGQIREYIRVTSSLVDTMRNSEDEAYIEHTKEEYDELVQMVMQLKESETKLEKILVEEKGPDNVEVPAEEEETPVGKSIETIVVEVKESDDKINNNDSNKNNNNLKKVTNEENEQLNKSLNKPLNDDTAELESSKIDENVLVEIASESSEKKLDHVAEPLEESDNKVIIKEIESIPSSTQIVKDDEYLNDILRKNILSCVEKVAHIEEMRQKRDNKDDKVEVVVRPVSVQSNDGSAYSENELWQNEIKNKMEISSMRLAALNQQQKRLLKYQEEAKQQLDEMNRQERQSQDNHHPSTSQDNFNMQSQSFSGNYNNTNRMYGANQIGVATTLPHSSDFIHSQQQNNIESEHGHSAHSNHSQDDRFSHRETNVGSSEEAAGGGRDSEAEEDEGMLTERGRLLQMKLRELQLKKQHMESLVTEFQKIQMETRGGSSHNTYSTSGEESADEEPTRKCNKSAGNIKNDDPFKVMEIKAIKTALQKTKDLMRSVENYEAVQMPMIHDDSFQMPSHSNVNDNKSEGGGSGSGWSNEDSVCRVRNTLPQRHKFTNEQHSQQYLQQQSQEANIASLQELTQELRMETEKIMSERARLKESVSNKEAGSRKHKKVNEEVRAGQRGHGTGVAGTAGLSGLGGGAGTAGTSGHAAGVSVGHAADGHAASAAPGPAERRQMQLRATLAEKQLELMALLNKQKEMCSSVEAQNTDPRGTSVNQSYNSELEEPDSRSEQIMPDSQISRDSENFRSGSDSGLVSRSMNTLPSHIGIVYGSDSDSASRNKNQRNRTRRRQPQERLSEDNAATPSSSSQNLRHEPRAEASNVNMVPPVAQNNENNMQYQHMPPPCWSAKSNQDMRTNQFTQNSHSQTMDRLLGSPQVPFPPSMPYNMMMPYGMGGLVGGVACGCGLWGAWCWQQLAAQQRDLLALREQLNHLEERWRAETASHTLNNQVPPGNRANNYWDNFRSYSRQNLLSASGKVNACVPNPPPAPAPHPLASRSHNTFNHPPPCPPHNKRNSEQLAYNSAPDVLNLNQTVEEAEPRDNLNRHEPTNPFRNLNIANPIPEIVQSHSNNLNAPSTGKKKSSSKLPAKNSTIKRNYSALDYSQTSNVNIASTSEMPNPNLASTSGEVHDKNTSKMFDRLRENVYSEVSTLIGANESYPDFLIQLFRELQMISSEPLRQRVLQSIRSVLSQYGSIVETQNNETREENRTEAVSTSSEINNYSSGAQMDDGIVRFLLQKSDEICRSEFLDALANQILNYADSRNSPQAKRRLAEMLSKYEGSRVCDVTGEVVENMPAILAALNEEESPQLSAESESSVLQDVAGALNLFSSSDPQLHQYEPWTSDDRKVDLIDCSEMHNGDLAEADQTVPPDAPEALPDLVDTEDTTPSEAEAEWLGLDRVPTRLHMEESSGKQKDHN